MTPLIVCADDFAIHNEASSAIFELISLGRITATSAMTWSPLWPEHALWVQDLRERFDMGLHLDASSDFARARGSRGLGRLMLDSQLRRLQASTCRDWIASQLDAFEEVWQAPPDHVDGHQHIQQFPVMRDVLLNELQRRYGRLPYLRLSRPASLGFDLKALFIQGMGANAFAKALAAQGGRYNQWLTGLYNFNPQPGRYPEVVRECLAALCPDTVMMCHPAKPGAQGDEIGLARSQEYAYLSSQAFLGDLARHGVNLVRCPMAA